MELFQKSGHVAGGAKMAAIEEELKRKKQEKQDMLKRLEQLERLMQSPAAAVPGSSPERRASPSKMANSADKSKVKEKPKALPIEEKYEDLEWQ
jgi:hypothetical protein